MINKHKTEIKWAFIFIGTVLIWSLLERLLGFHDEHLDKHEYFSMLFFIPAILIYVLALKDKKNNHFNGQLNYKQGFISGLIITLIVTIFTPLTQLVITEVISPNYFENIINFSVEGGYDTLEDARAYFSYRNYAIQGTIFSLAMGIITSLIVPVFLKTKTR